MNFEPTHFIYCVDITGTTPVRKIINEFPSREAAGHVLEIIARDNGRYLLKRIGGELQARQAGKVVKRWIIYPISKKLEIEGWIKDNN